ncbi:MAG: glycosyltransferase [Cyclobacteriaceae bacterium]
MIVAIGIITRGRNTLLKGCLESIARLTIPNGKVQVHFILVDNNPTDDARAGFEQVDFPFDSTYVHEPQRGIVVARNRVLAESKKINADVLGFIDDDELAAPGWLLEGIRMMNDAYEISTGPCRFEFEETVPNWISKTEIFRFKTYPDGPLDKASSTRNVFVKMDFILQNELKFSQAFNDTGGSDTLFFKQARRLGARTYWNSNQIVTERIPQNRTKLNWIFKRNLRLGGAKFKRWNHLFPTSRAISKGLPVVLSLPFWLLQSLLTCWHSHWWVIGMEKSAKGLGVFLAMMGKPYAEYKNS